MPREDPEALLESCLGEGKTVTQVVMVTGVVMGDQVTQEVESSVEKLDKLNEMQSTCETQDLKQ